LPKEKLNLGAYLQYDIDCYRLDELHEKTLLDEESIKSSGSKSKEVSDFSLSVYTIAESKQLSKRKNVQESKEEPEPRRNS